MNGMAEPAAPRLVRAPRGSTLSCRGWPQEAALRMLMNNLDPEVAERPQDLIVYGGTGRAARNWDCFDALVRCLRALGADETLLVQSGKPVGVFRSHPEAPRVLISNAMLVPAWATWDEFRRLEGLGLTMYGQMTAGSWIYIGTQGIIQGTYETFAAAARAQFGGSLRGRLVLTAGLGGMGGAQPMAITMNEGVGLIVEADPARIERRARAGWVDEATESLEAALHLAARAVQERRPRSIALLGNAAEVYPEIVRRDVAVDIVTDQTSAHDLLEGYLPEGLSPAEAAELRRRAPAEYQRRAELSVARHVEAMLALKRRGATVFDYGNNIRAQARRGA